MRKQKKKSQYKMTKTFNQIKQTHANINANSTLTQKAP